MLPTALLFFSDYLIDVFRQRVRRKNRREKKKLPYGNSIVEYKRRDSSIITPGGNRCIYRRCSEYFNQRTAFLIGDCVLLY